MCDLQVRELLNRAEYMLWVIAAADIDGVRTHRRIVLLKLEELEAQAHELGILNLYAALVENGAVSSRYSRVTNWQAVLKK